MEIKTFLEEIIPAIEGIEGGSYNSVNDFCSRVNETLSVLNLKLEVSIDCIVTIKEL